MAIVLPSLACSLNLLDTLPSLVVARSNGIDMEQMERRVPHVSTLQGPVVLHCLPTSQRHNVPPWLGPVPHEHRGVG